MAMIDWPDQIYVVLGDDWIGTNGMETGEIFILSVYSVADNELLYSEAGSDTADDDTNRLKIRVTWTVTMGEVGTRIMQIYASSSDSWDLAATFTHALQTGGYTFGDLYDHSPQTDLLRNCDLGWIFYTNSYLNPKVFSSFFAYELISVTPDPLVIELSPGSLELTKIATPTPVVVEFAPTAGDSSGDSGSDTGSDGPWGLFWPGCCCEETPLFCNMPWGPFVGTHPTSILLDVSGVANDVCQKCGWMNGSWEIPWWSASNNGNGTCSVYYTHVFSAEESDRDTCCYPFTSAPDIYSVSISFTLNAISGFRSISAGVQANCALVTPESITYRLQQDGNLHQFPITPGSKWTIPFVTDHDCDGSGATVTVEIPDVV